MSRAYTLLHLITGLDTGGAELALARLVEGLSARGVRNVVVSMMQPGTVARRIVAAGVPVVSLGLRRGAMHPAALKRLRAIVTEHAPDVMQTWMYHADLLGTLARRGRTPALVWSVRASNVDMRHYSMLSALTRRACVWLSSRPDAILANSEAGAAFHRQFGYAARRWAVIPNGVDLDVFRPDARDRAAVRAALGLHDDAIAVGLIGRVDPMKGHGDFLSAAASLLIQAPSVHLVLAGQGAVPDGQPFQAWLAAHPMLAPRVHLLGRRDDMPSLQRALDVACSASLFGEGFPNVVAEAMASGVPVVSTDVGDAAQVIGDTGLVVAPGRPAALATACLGLVRDPRRRAALGDAARARIEERFGLAHALDAHDQLYRDLIATVGRA